MNEDYRITWPNVRIVIEGTAFEALGMAASTSADLAPFVDALRRDGVVDIDGVRVEHLRQTKQ